jgi:hypothetical protein
MAIRYLIRANPALNDLGPACRTRANAMRLLCSISLQRVEENKSFQSRERNLLGKQNLRAIERPGAYFSANCGLSGISST